MKFTARTRREPPRPHDLQVRYSTSGGSHVDVTGSGREKDTHKWHCHGCREESRIPRDFEAARGDANDHARYCHAIPLN
jgi:hypothetical protein